MLNKVFQTAIVARTLPGALMFPYINGVIDGLIGTTGIVIMSKHPIIGACLFGYALVSSTVTVALASRNR